MGREIRWPWKSRRRRSGGWTMKICDAAGEGLFRDNEFDGLPWQIRAASVASAKRRTRRSAGGTARMASETKVYAFQPGLRKVTLGGARGWLSVPPLLRRIGFCTTSPLLLRF